jgi:hypothetical protein
MHVFKKLHTENGQSFAKSDQNNKHMHVQIYGVIYAILEDEILICDMQRRIIQRQ